jgi:hypothetical protein
MTPSNHRTNGPTGTGKVHSSRDQRKGRMKGTSANAITGIKITKKIVSQ